MFQPQRGLDQSGRQKIALQVADRLVGSRRFIFEIFQIDDLSVELEIHLLHESPAGDDVLDAGLPNAGVHDVGRDGVVQIGGDAAIESEGHVGQKAGDRRRHQEADIALVGREDAAEEATEDEGPQERIAAC